MVERADPAVSLTAQAALLGVSRSSLYYQPASPAPEEVALKHRIDEIYTAYPFYGSRRVTATLCREGQEVNRKAVQRHMREMGIAGVAPGPHTSRPHPTHPTYPYLLRHVTAAHPNHVWGIDITYIRLQAGWLYLVAVRDWHARYVVAWALDQTRELGFVLEAVDQALEVGCPVIWNSDQGSHFTSPQYLDRLDARGIQISMDGKGRALDNIFTERLWRTVKYEEVYLRSYGTPREARQSLTRYLAFYNHERPHQALGYRTPAEVYDGRVPAAQARNDNEKDLLCQGVDKMVLSFADIKGGRCAVGAGTLRLGLDAARYPCCVCCAEGADGTTGRCATVRSLRLRSLAGDPAGVVKPRRLRLWGTRAWELRAPTPRVLRSAGGVEEGTTGRPARLVRRQVVTTGRQDGRILCGARGVGLLGGQEGCRVVGLALAPHGVDEADPLVGQRPHGHGVTLALPPLALVVGQRPRLFLGALPGELLQGVAQRLVTGVAPMRFSEVAALKGHRRGASQGLDAGRAGVAPPLIAPFRQQSRRQPLSGPREAREGPAIGMQPKKARDLVIIGGDLGEEHAQLGGQRQHQARLGARHHGVGPQLRLVQALPDLRGFGRGGRMPRRLEHGGDLLDRGILRLLGRGKGLQEGQRGRLLQFAEQLQRHRIVGLETGRELVDQAGLALDQGVLVARERLEFGDQGAIRGQAAQVSHIAASRARQQVGVDGVGLGPRGLAVPIDGLGIDRIDGQARVEQGGDEQSPVRLDDTGQMVGMVSDIPQSFKERHQRVQPLGAMGHTGRPDALPRFIDHHGVMMLIGPINTGIPHRHRPRSLSRN